MYDSWGKNQDGMMFGNIQLFGFMDECQDVEVSPEQVPETNFVGKYCGIVYQ